MFCYQCQETARNQGCTVQGVCGKNDETAKMLDLLLYTAKGVALCSVKSREIGLTSEETGRFILEALFTTVTNVNFDPERIRGLIRNGLDLRDRVRTRLLAAQREVSAAAPVLHDAAVWRAPESEWMKKAESVGVLSTANEDIRSLRELLVYGAKGIAAYADHAAILDHTDPAIPAFLEKALAATLDDTLGADQYVALVLEAGEKAVTVMALLDKANTQAYGHPQVTPVYTGTRPGPGILVSGHDLRDFEEILRQTENTGVNVYTHGEMLPANAYPAFRRYKHLVGNYGTSWFNQQKEFGEFNGAVIMTTNCLQKPLDSYKDRIFTTGLVAWPGVPHIADRPQGGNKDFSAVIAKARSLGEVREITGKTIPIGFAHETVMGVADKVIEAVKSGAIKRFVVMGGCDGRHKERNYFTDFAKALPADTIILTAGCAKYRYNMLDLGDIGGIPRVLDAGQCNDSYSLVYIALKLKEVFGLNDINQLPISYNIAWYEQKAVAVLLALLYLGVKGIRLGPTLPGFLSANVAKILVETFDIKLVADVQTDLQNVMQGK